jgi:hypothetical protein
LLADNPQIARRWLPSVAKRLAVSQSRIIGLLYYGSRSKIQFKYLAGMSD